MRVKKDLIIDIIIILGTLTLIMIIYFGRPPIQPAQAELRPHYFNLITVKSGLCYRKICTGPAIFVDTIDFRYCKIIRVSYLTDSTMERLLDNVQIQLKSEK